MKYVFRYKWLIFTLCVWAIIFCVPSLRYHLQVATQGSPWIQFTLAPTHYGEDVSFSALKNPPLPIKVRELQRKSNIGSPTTHEILDTFDKLIDKNPDVPWLIALRLRQTVGIFMRNRQGGDFADIRNYEEIQKGKPSIERNDNELNYTPQQMRTTLALCRRGEKLEPQNAYFTWVRVYFLMSNWQDEEAIKAMNEAASKSYFNNHHAEYHVRYADAAEYILSRPLTAYEKLIIAISPLESNFYNAQMREMARILSWQGVKMRRAGDNTKAVVFLANTYHVMTLAMKGDSLPIDFLVDYAIASIISASPSYHSKTRMDDALVDTFIAYANKYNRPDLAQQIAQDRNSNSATFTKLQAYTRHNYNPDPSLVSIGITSILLQCTVLLILSICGAFIGWLFLNMRRSKSTFIHKSPKPIDQYKGIFACSGIISFLLAFLLLAIIVSVKNTITFADFGWGWGALDIFQNPIHTKSLTDIIDIFSNTGDISYYPAFWRVLVFVTPIVCGALFSLVHIRGKEHKSTFPQTLSRNIYLALLFLAWGIIAMTSQYELTQTILAAICGIFILFSIFRMWRRTKENSDATFAILQSSLSGWICTGSVLILILLISQSVTNHHLQHWANNQIRGEMHIIHQVQDTPPLNN